jgi:3D (Asp-Asp-Asp) domain-containing protein
MLLSVAIMLGSVMADAEQRTYRQPPASPTEVAQKHTTAPQRRLSVTVGAYSPRRKETQGNPRDTASGAQVQSGVIALSRDVERALGVEFGDQVMVEGVGTFVFHDRMAAHKKRRVDIFMESTAAAREFGEKPAYVSVAGQD